MEIIGFSIGVIVLILGVKALYFAIKSHSLKYQFDKKELEKKEMKNYLYIFIIYIGVAIYGSLIGASPSASDIALSCLELTKQAIIVNVLYLVIWYIWKKVNSEEEVVINFLKRYLKTGFPLMVVIIWFVGFLPKIINLIVD